MKLKTSELTGAALDWAVAKCEGYPMGIWYDEEELPMIRDDEVPEWKPSINWAQGGAIIEREKISVWARGNEWAAESFVPNQQGLEGVGPTPLIAAMRCYVTSQLGDEVEVPESILDEMLRGLMFDKAEQ